MAKKTSTVHIVRVTGAYAQFIPVAKKLKATFRTDNSCPDGRGHFAEFTFRDYDIAWLFRSGSANGNTSVGFRTEVR